VCVQDSVAHTDERTSIPTMRRDRFHQAHISYAAYVVQMGGAATTVRVSRETLDELERFQQALKTKTADETIRAIMRLKRKELVDRAYGILKGKVSPFTEADRLDSHY
jgi:hypothetical protein